MTSSSPLIPANFFASKGKASITIRLVLVSNEPPLVRYERVSKIDTPDGGGTCFEYGRSFRPTLRQLGEAMDNTQGSDK